MILGSTFSPSLIKVNLESEDRHELFEELVDFYVSQNSRVSRSDVLNAIVERESKQSTGIKRGIAIPHGQVEGITGVQAIIGVSQTGIDYDSLDGEPVHLVFMLFSSPSSCSSQLSVLHRVATLLADPRFYRDVLQQTTSDGVYSTICKYEKKLLSAVV